MKNRGLSLSSLWSLDSALRRALLSVVVRAVASILAAFSIAKASKAQIYPPIEDTAKVSCSIVPIRAGIKTAGKAVSIGQSGTAWKILVNGQTRYLTAAHVVAEADRIQIFCLSKYHAMKIERYSPTLDLALLSPVEAADESSPSSLLQARALIRYPQDLPVIAKSEALVNTEAAGTGYIVGFYQSAKQNSKAASNASLPRTLQPLLIHLDMFLDRRSWSPYDLKTPISALRPGFSGSPFMVETEDHRLIPAGIILQTKNPGQALRGTSLAKIWSFLGLTEGKSLGLPYKIEWSFRRMAKNLERSRTLVLADGRRISELCPLSRQVTVSSWNPIGGSDWADGGGSDWADGGGSDWADGGASGVGSTRRSFSGINIGNRSTFLELRPEMKVLGFEGFLSSISVNGYYAQFSSSSNCAFRGLRWSDGKILWSSHYQSVADRIQSIDELLSVLGRQSSIDEELRNFSRASSFIDLAQLKSHQPLPVCDLVKNGLKAGGTSMSFEVDGEMIIHSKSLWRPPQSIFGAMHAGGPTLNCSRDRRTLTMKSPRLNFEMTSLGIQGTLLNAQGMQPFSIDSSDPWGFQITNLDQGFELVYSVDFDSPENGPFMNINQVLPAATKDSGVHWMNLEQFTIGNGN